MGDEGGAAPKNYWKARLRCFSRLLEVFLFVFMFLFTFFYITQNKPILITNNMNKKQNLNKKKKWPFSLATGITPLPGRGALTSPGAAALLLGRVPATRGGHRGDW